jgi:hypothetical protein
MADHQLAFTDAKGGMNGFDPPHKIATNQLARMVNCAIVDGLPTTRPGGRVVPLSGSPSEIVTAAPMQGCIFYNPAAGQGGIIFSEANASLAIVSGGRKILVTIEGRRPKPTAVLRDITGTFVSSSQNHLAWLSQWEDLLIVADGEGPTFIYSPTDGARLSLGYNMIDKGKSEIPNGATVLAYAHARGLAVVNSRQILVGDPLFRTDLTSSSNLAGFTEQVYWATGPYFFPPSMMGAVNAAAILPLQNTQHGHGELMFHCAGGVFSLDVSRYPRSEWANMQLVKHALLQAGATGPYAVAVQVGDQIFRTRMGAQSLRSAAASMQAEGNPAQTLSAHVDTWFAGDYPRWLRFASVNIWGSARRVLFTTGPVVHGSFRWHRGLVSRNTDASLTEPETPAIWEGLWTFPPQAAGIVQLVNGIFDGDERQFFWARGADGRNRLVELSSRLGEDVLEDGSTRAIRCQVMTRAIDAGKPWEKRQYVSARLYLRNISGQVKWGVWFRPDENPGWRYYQSGSVTAPDYAADLEESVGEDSRSVPIELGLLPDDCSKSGKVNESRSIQFLVRWEGQCTFEAIKVEHTPNDLSETQFQKTGLTVKLSKPSGCHYDDFEYSLTDENPWLPQT